MRRNIVPMIVIIGTNEIDKAILFQKMIKFFSFCKKREKIIRPIINYSEAMIKIEGNVYKLVDTPAFVLSPKTEIEKGIKTQTENLLKTSDLICWVIDKINEEEILTKKYLKKFSAPQILIFNKIDLTDEKDFYAYQSLWPQYFLTISAGKEINLDQLSQQITEILPHSVVENTNQKENQLRLLIFGPPNSGKSTLMNYLLKENRSLVTPIAGTTQEPVISNWNWQQINFQLVDTAGITKEQKIKWELWKNCDLAWAVIDATLPLTKQILQIINLGEKHNKPLIIIINKYDLIADKKILKEELRSRLKSLGYAPIIYLSALKGKGISSLIKTLAKMLEQSQKKASKKGLAELIEKMLLNNPPKYFKGNKLKIYFAKQELGLVQQFIFFVNNPQWSHFSYQRYIINYLRKNLELEYLPIRIILKKSS
ncbi:GTPase [endosymbiont GvMRE of Glomus versiforme]|uniref:GTPase n=1 Tax=endosymbiont GvMRE of Glomus versiforme TaxID=2039283 RepID=UPI000EC937C4|nr:GTPase [endosymbiont GvMRE of Glomus versiforme]RHZ35530.1 GTPase Der [endosymbiont GvMRE of Glomus versiforme]